MAPSFTSSPESAASRTLANRKQIIVAKECGGRKKLRILPQGGEVLVGSPGTEYTSHRQALIDLLLFDNPYLLTIIVQLTHISD